MKRLLVAGVLLLFASSVVSASGGGVKGGIDVPGVILGLAIMLFAAKIGGEIAERWFKQPGVLGELLAGVVISPFALGPYLGFHPITGSTIPISPELDLIGQIGVVILLFLSGLETDVGQFMRFGVIAGFVALGGVILPFFLGYLAILYLYTPTAADNASLHNIALFVGAVLTATSVGITARVLKDIDRMNSEEGTTILAAAVIDDILGIIVLAIVVGIVGAAAEEQELNALDELWHSVFPDNPTFNIVKIILFAAVFWGLVLFIGLRFTDKISRLFGVFKTPGSAMVLALVIGFVVSYLAEYVHLALIIGSYAAGLALSASHLKEELIESITPIYHFLVPIFFVAMGMMVNLEEAKGILAGGLGIIILLFAIIGKVLGCGVAAYLGGFNIHGAMRVGTGMVPRGEVGLIVAYIGLLEGVIQQPLYVIAVVMSIITTLITPPFLKTTFSQGPTKGWTKGKIGE